MNSEQILDWFRLKAVQQAIIEEKKNDPATWKPHPDAPECIEARQYLCTVVEEQSEELMYLKEKATTLQAEVSREAAESMLPGRLAKPAWMWTLGVFSSVGTPSSTLQQPAEPPGLEPGLKRLADEKAMQKAEQQQERDRVRAQRVADAKSEREKQRNSPAGLAQAMIKDLNSISLKAGEKKADSHKGVVFVPVPVCSDYHTRFSGHLNTIETMRTKLNTVVANDEENDETTKDLKKCLEQTNETLSQWARLKSLYCKGKDASSSGHNQD